MKNKTKLIIYNTGIAVVAIPLFAAKSFALLSNPVAAIISGSLLAAACFAGNVCICKQEVTITAEFLQSVDNIADVLPKLKQFKRHPVIGDECKKLLDQYNCFIRKKKTLETMCGDQNAYDTMNIEIEDVMFKNMMRVCKRILLLQSASTHADEIRHKAYIQNIIDQNDTLLTQYDELLEEVSQLGDNYNTYTSDSLQTITKTLRKFRLEDEQD